MEPSTVYERFVAACSSGDEVGARALSTDDGWHRSGDSTRRFVEQVRGEPVRIAQAGAMRVIDPRAAQPITLGEGEREQTLWMLLRRDDGWKVDGFAPSWDLAGPYLYGEIERPPAFAELPPSTAAEHWFQRFANNDNPEVADQGAGALSLLEELRREASDIRLVRTVELAQRCAASIAFAQADGSEQTVWAMLAAEPRSGLVQLVGRSFFGSTALLLRGTNAPWPPPASDPSAQRFSAEEATELFAQALGKARDDHSRMTGRPSALEGPMGDLLTDLFQTLIDPDERPQTPRGAPSEAESRLAKSVGDVLRGFAESTRIDDELDANDLKVDSQFMKDHANDLMSQFVGALGGNLAPDGVEVGKPQEGKPRVRIDVGDLLSGLFSGSSDAE